MSRAGVVVAITHLPSPRMAEAVRTFAGAAEIDVALAGRQHEAYRAMLARAGAEVVVLDANRDYPDAVFVEDTAIVLEELAVVTSMGTPSRRAEPAGIEPELRRHRSEIVRVEAPATLEGGDVVCVGRTILVGASSRTNREGIAALADATRRFGYDVRAVRLTGCLHLRTGCTALPDGRLLVNTAWVDERDLEGFALVQVPDAEPSGANVVSVRDMVLTSNAHPRTIAQLEALGFEVDSVDQSEFAKADGCSTCLSILVT